MLLFMRSKQQRYNMGSQATRAAKQNKTAEAALAKTAEAELEGVSDPCSATSKETQRFSVSFSSSV